MSKTNMNQSAPTPLKALLLVGKGLEISPEIESLCQTRYKSMRDYAVIHGDISIGSIEHSLQSMGKKIDKSTLITILAHGHAAPNDSKKHTIETVNRKGTNITQEYLAALASMVNGESIHVNFHACRGGLANKAIKALPAGSTLETHVPSKYPQIVPLLYDTMYHELSLYLSNTPYDSKSQFLASFPWHHEPATYNVAHNDGTVTKFKEVRFFKDISKQLDELHTSESLGHFAQKIIADNISRFSTAFPDYVIPKEIQERQLTPDEIQSFFIGRLMHSMNARFNAQDTELFVQYVTSLKNMGLDLNHEINHWTVLMCAASETDNEEIVTSFIKNGANIEYQNPKGDTPLGRAISLGSAGTAKFLIKNGANVNTPNHAGETPLFYAAVGGDIDTATLLIQHNADVNKHDGHNTTPLFAAASNGHLNVVELFIKHGSDPNIKNDKGYTPLLAAAVNGYTDIAASLIKHNSNIEASNDNGATALTLAVLSGHIEMARLLIKSGAKVSTSNNNGETPLFAAAYQGNVAMVKLLINNNADIEAQTNDKNTALIAAAERGSADVVKLLVKHGAKIGVTNENGDNAAMCAKNAGHTGLSELLIKLEVAQIAAPLKAQKLSSSIAPDNDLNRPTPGQPAPLSGPSRASGNQVTPVPRPALTTRRPGASEKTVSPDKRPRWR